MLTHAEFCYDVWAEKSRSKPIPPYVRAPKGRFFIFGGECGIYALLLRKIARLAA